MLKTSLIIAMAALSLMAALLFSDQSEARKLVSSGKINGPVIMSCSNGMRESWTSYHAPNDHSFFHQDLVLGKGDYTLSLIPNGRFPFSAFVYRGDSRQYVGGRQNVTSFSHRFSVRSWSGNKFLIQMKKLGATCRGCAVTMTLTARNCTGTPRRPSTPSAKKVCNPNYCGDPDPKNSVFGVPFCHYKKGARGGMCGTPGN